MSVITNVTVPVGNWAAEPTVAARGSEVGPEIGIADINPAKRGGGRLDGQSNAPRSVPALSTAGPRPRSDRSSTARLLSPNSIHRLANSLDRRHIPLYRVSIHDTLLK